MPLRVYCRCGQEVIVRYSEWVYVVLGLAILATAANIVVAIILFRDVRRLENEVEERVARLIEAREPEALAESAGGDPGRAPVDGPGAARPKDAPFGDGSSESPQDQGPVLAESNEPAARADGERSAPASRQWRGGSLYGGPPRSDAEEVATSVEKEGAERDRTTTERHAPRARSSPRLASAARAPLVATDDAAGLSTGDGESSTAIARLFEQLELLPSSSDTSDGDASSRPRPEVAEMTPPAGRKLLDWPPIARLALLSRAAKSTSETPLVLAAFLLDPDPRLRAIALDALESTGLSRAAASEARPLLEHALEIHAGDEHVDRLRALAGEAASSSATSDLESAWERAASDARSLASRAPSLEAWRGTLQPLEEHGCDIVFLLDATQSMGEALPLLKESSAWLLPSLAWGVPSCRVGLVLYRDEVLDAAGFSIEPEREVLPLLLSARAEGGGDVPEGVRDAIEEGLSLGKFAWREDAAKHLIVVGDQPPRYEEIRALESLVANARREGQYRFHFLGIPEEGSESVAFFDRFAKAGGGRHANGPATVIGREAAACVLGADDPTIVSELFGVLPRVFGGKAE